MKFVLVVLVVVVGLWMLLSRTRRRVDPPAPAPKEPGRTEVAPMLACAHCGVHLPRPDAVFDADGRAFCSDAHRLAGPR